MVPIDVSAADAQKDESLQVASIITHGNVLFGARSLVNDKPLYEIGGPLLQAALNQATSQGEQPQAIASLDGLCEWTTSCIEGRGSSDALDALQAEDVASFEAVKAIATGVPRAGHSVVGVGTYRDGEVGWKRIA
eukprot:CAMPEP_0119557188 /NCGR_PEP_ID=MMETSP1352-20130426/8934_1 /TAXON_ID=265584 /ORGANISM="Stauroneis constricta, Strain CCMP1120" /LENGTH=134 /DNA_ID=CAMNT_0007604253 /DNA_START=12 /DNA_END=413 /DNA_ORIENTATION=-